MSKKKFVAILPALAILSLVGTGFSAWYFNTNADVVSNNIDVKVEDFADIGCFKLDPNSNLSLVLDQTEYNQQGLHFEGSTTIYYYLPVGNLFNGDDSAASGLSGELANNKITSISDVTMTYKMNAYANGAGNGTLIEPKVEDSSNIAHWVNWQTTAAITTTSIPGWKKLQSSDDGYNKAYARYTQYELKLNSDQLVGQDSLFNFHYANEPSNLDQYDLMTQAVNNTHFLLSITANYQVPQE